MIVHVALLPSRVNYGLALLFFLFSMLILFLPVLVSMNVASWIHPLPDHALV